MIGTYDPLDAMWNFLHWYWLAAGVVVVALICAIVVLWRRDPWQ